ncbi:hypothetical protein AYO38_00600 [bacterium SCGC AG-212-C10]|nr:hypothetical protein AYO38_00600 [bacterium SCGC AG-212-C10]
MCTVSRHAKRAHIGSMLIVLPSIVSGIGVSFIIAAILVDQQVFRDIFACLGAGLLWADFFVTMAIFRRTMRSIDQRLHRIEMAIERTRRDQLS